MCVNMAELACAVASLDLRSEFASLAAGGGAHSIERVVERSDLLVLHLVGDIELHEDGVELRQWRTADSSRKSNGVHRGRA